MMHSTAQSQVCLHQAVLRVVGVVVATLGYTTAIGEADVFIAKRACIIHEEATSHSPRVGRLEVGQRATVLPDAPSGK